MRVDRAGEHGTNAMGRCARRAAPAFLLVLAAACSGSEDDGPPIAIQDVELSLLVRDDLRHVVDERESDPVRVVPLGPGRDVPWDGTTLPCLEMAPPARVEIALPPPCVAAPEKSVNRPPASSTTGWRAAQSQVCITGSSMISARPVATSAWP